jgi:hypothetical protein
MIVVDELRHYSPQQNETLLLKHNRYWCHLMTDGDPEELHVFAEKIGLKRSWFQNKSANPILWHYDLTNSNRKKAIQAGAIEVKAQHWFSMRLQQINDQVARQPQLTLQAVAPYLSLPLESESLTRVLRHVLISRKIAYEMYCGTVTHRSTGESSPRHFWLQIPTPAGFCVLDYRAGVWFPRVPPEHIPSGCFAPASYPQVEYKGQRWDAPDLDERGFAFLASARQFGALYPLGYGSRKSAALLQQAMADPAAILVDARKKPYANGRPEWCEEGLSQAWPGRYRVFRGKQRPYDNWLGNVNYNNGGPIALVDAQRGLRSLQTLLLQGHSVVLLCGCSNYATCHTRWIAERLARFMPQVAIQPLHLRPQQAAFPI